MRPRKRRFGFFNWDDDFDSIFEDMENLMRDLMEKIERGELKEGGPFVYGFSMRVNPDGKIIFDEFGNKPTQKGIVSEEREPITDILNKKDEIVVICELPGVNKEDIQLKIAKDSMHIKVDTAQRKYNKFIKLPGKVDPQSAKAHYKNGVLEVRIKKVGHDEENGVPIKIE